MKLNPKFLRGQEYDRAANMGGITGGVQAIMTDKLAVRVKRQRFCSCALFTVPYQAGYRTCCRDKTPIDVINVFASVQEIYNSSMIPIEGGIYF